MTSAPSGRVRPEAWGGHVEGFLDGILIRWDDSPEGRGPWGAAIRQGRGVVCGDCLSDPSFLPWREAAAARSLLTFCTFPIMEKCLRRFSGTRAETGCGCSIRRGNRARSGQVEAAGCVSGRIKTPHRARANPLHHAVAAPRNGSLPDGTEKLQRALS